MKLGTASQIVIGTEDLEASALVYDRIGYRRVAHGNTPGPFIQYTDDSSLILLTQDGMKYIGLIYFDKNMLRNVDELMSQGVEFQQQTNDAAGNFFHGIFTTPDGVMINLVNFDPGNMYQPDRKLINIPENDLGALENYPNKMIGIFGEYSVPVSGLETSLEYWQKLGFDVLSRNEEPYPWAIVTDGLNVLGLHQTTEFNTQAITYFAPDMEKRIAALKNNGLEDNINRFSGSGNSDKNAVLTTMENQHFFLFSF
jgi:hypothetical protein